MIGVVLVWLNQFCGCFAILNYQAEIFKDSGSSLSPNMSAIVVGVIQLIGAYIATFLVDRAGRKVEYLKKKLFPVTLKFRSILRSYSLFHPVELSLVYLAWHCTHTFKHWNMQWMAGPGFLWLRFRFAFLLLPGES